MLGHVLGHTPPLYLIYPWTYYQQGNQRLQIPRPATCQCLATFTPLKSWYFFGTSFSTHSNFYILIDRATQEVPMKRIWNKLSVQFLRYTPLNCYAWYLLTRQDVTYVELCYIFIRSTLTYREYVCKRLQCFIEYYNSYLSICFSMGHTFDDRNIEIWLFAFYMLNVAHVKNDVKWLPIVTKFGTLIGNMSRTGLYDCHIF